MYRCVVVYVLNGTRIIPRGRKILVSSFTMLWLPRCWSTRITLLIGWGLKRFGWGKIGNPSASKGFDIHCWDFDLWSKFPCEDLVKIWLRLDRWTPAARRLEGQALYGAGLGAAPTVESLGRSLQVLKTRWTARCIGVSNMVTWSTHWIHQVLISSLLSFDDDFLRLHWWLGFGVDRLVFGCFKLHRRPEPLKKWAACRWVSICWCFPFFRYSGSWDLKIWRDACHLMTIRKYRCRIKIMFLHPSTWVVCLANTPER